MNEAAKQRTSKSRIPKAVREQARWCVKGRKRGELHLADACHGLGDEDAGQDGAAIKCILHHGPLVRRAESVFVARRGKA